MRLDSRREVTGSIEGRTRVPPLASWLAFRWVIDVFFQTGAARRARI